MYDNEASEPEGTEYGPETGLDDEGVLDASDTLEGDPGDDPLDPGIIPPDRWSAAERYGSTNEEEQSGESLDQLLAEEEPEADPYATAEDEDEEDTGAGVAPDATPAGGYSADPRAGRLVAEDEGAHPDEEPDVVARDVGVDSGAASAEEAAVHALDTGAEDAGDEDPEAGDHEG
jgi:hypothetical protein